jgi:hypothetical protein
MSEIINDIEIENENENTNIDDSINEDDLSFVPREANFSDVDVTSEYLNEYADLYKQKNNRVYTVYIPVKKINSDNYKLPKSILAKGFTSVKYFDSGHNPGGYIYHAMTGQRSNYRLGQKQQDLFFKVADATHMTGFGPHTLFYDNPEEYERHFMTVLPTNIKQKWYEKYMAAKLEYC